MEESMLQEQRKNYQVAIKESNTIKYTKDIKT